MATNFTVAQDDLGVYIEDKDAGIYATRRTESSFLGPIGILQWGLAQFGTTGILGYAPTSISNIHGIHVIQP